MVNDMKKLTYLLISLVFIPFLSLASGLSEASLEKTKARVEQFDAELKQRSSETGIFEILETPNASYMTGKISVLITCNEVHDEIYNELDKVVIHADYDKKKYYYLGLYDTMEHSSKILMDVIKDACKNRKAEYNRRYGT